MNSSIQCPCGTVELQLIGEPLAQFFCHCDDCLAVHGKAFPSTLYPTASVSVMRGEIDSFTLRTTPRTKCRQCGTYLFAEVPGYGVRGVNSDLLQGGRFNPEFHVQCRNVQTPISDDLPHYKDNPARFYGSDEVMPW